MSDMYFKNLPDTTTPIIDVNLNKLNDVKVSTTEPITGEKVWIKKGKNLFNEDTIFRGYIETSSQKIVIAQDEFYSCYAKVNPNTIYTVSKQAGKSFRIATTNIVPTNGVTYTSTTANHTGTSITITTGANDNYICIFFYATSNGDTGGYENMANTIQVEQNPSATTYEPYIEEEILVKNDNGVYEEFINISDIVSKIENNNNYSSVEQKIGKWITSEPLYRKVVSYKPTSTIGAANTVTNIQIAHNISNFKMCTNARVVTDTANIFPAFNGSSALSSGTTIPMVGETYIYLRIVNDTWNAGKTWYFVLEYIKTTN